MCVLETIRDPSSTPRVDCTGTCTTCSERLAIGMLPVELVSSDLSESVNDLNDTRASIVGGSES